jgi:hypothetical protein
MSQGNISKAAGTMVIEKRQQIYKVVAVMALPVIYGYGKTIGSYHGRSPKGSRVAMRHACSRPALIVVLV